MIRVRARLVAAIGLCLLGATLIAEAERPGRIPQLCFLTFDPGTARSPSPRFEAFFQGLRDLGYVHGQSITIDYLVADGRSERFPELAAECVRLKADIIVVSTTPAAHAAKNATRTIPIVMVALGDPVGTSRDLGVREHAEGLLTTAESIFRLQRARVTELAARHRLPAVYPYSVFARDSGGLMAYDVNESDLHKRAATYVDKILKGAKPSDLAVQQPTKFDLVINMKTAKTFSVSCQAICF